MGRERFEAEFGTYSSWIAARANDLAPAERIAGACRGTADPNLLELIADAGELSAGVTVIDAGCGLGGPAAWFAKERGCSVTGVDVMHRSTAGARVLFPNLSLVTSSLRDLPFRPGTFDSGTCLGVVELIDDKDRAFTELSRVMGARGRLVLYDYVAVADFGNSRIPAADRFISLDHLLEAAARGGFSLLDRARIDDDLVAASPWQEISRRIQNDIAVAHRSDPRLARIEAERSSFNVLRRRGSIEPWLLVMQNGRTCP